jgi:hypothetical protein
MILSEEPTGTCLVPRTSLLLDGVGTLAEPERYDAPRSVPLALAGPESQVLLQQE